MQAGLPLFPGTVTAAFTALQGTARSPDELLRCIHLLYQGKAHLAVWIDAVKATRQIRKKVLLPPSLQLLLDLQELPANLWDCITSLWATTADPLSQISPGIRLNPSGYAGLENYNVETADFFETWTSGNVGAIASLSGRELDRPDVKEAFRVIIASPNLWTLNNGAQVLSSSLKRLRYVGALKPALIATWLREKVGLTPYDVVARFAPFA